MTAQRNGNLPTLHFYEEELPTKYDPTGAWLQDY